MKFSLHATDGAARAGTLRTAHGDVATPVFMPVGTAGTVKAMTADAVRATGATMVLGNTYHLMLRPGAERVAALGGLHRFMDWPGPILTDSGGFQVMSLSGLRKLDADGVTFQSHIDGTRYRLTPESSTEIQHLLDATVTMAFAVSRHPRCRRRFHAPVDALGGALPRRVRRPPRLRPVRHRARLHLCRSARRIRGSPRRPRVRGHRDRRSRGRRGAAGHVRYARCYPAARAGGRPALSDGGRHAR